MNYNSSSIIRVIFYIKYNILEFVNYIGDDKMIKHYRELKKITQEQMSINLGITLRHYQNIESYRSIPSVIIGGKISTLLGVSIFELWHDFF